MSSFPTANRRRTPRFVAGSLATLASVVFAMFPGCRSTPPVPKPVTPAIATAAEPDPAPAATLTTEARVEAAREVAEVGDYEEALRIFQSLLSENPTLTTAFIGIGDIHLAQGNYDEAEPAFARAVRLEPSNFDAQFGHGRVLQLLLRFAEAVKAYHRALAIRPYSVDTNVNIATAYLQLEEPDLAVPFAEKAVELDPDNGAARINLGAAYERVGRYGDAIRQYEVAMELMEPSPPLLLNLINAYVSEKRFQEAVNAAEILLQVEPSANAHERMAFAFFRLGQYEDSKNAYRRAVETDPKHWPSWNGIGVNALNRWLASGREDRDAKFEARDAFRNSLRIKSDQPKVVALLSKYYAG
ncbi:MAG: tetratricopeptide repeat protein [Planctomycetota bacterium]|jgi:tetratricopeptide (TPR) repeat protein